MLRLRYICIGFVLLCTYSLSAQDAMFSQFYASPLYTNPALAGANKCGRISANYRNQWAAIPGAFSSFNASYDQHFDQLAGAIGLVATNLREGNGSYSTTTVGAIYSYNLQVNDVFSIKTAVQASFINRHADWSGLTFNDQFDDVLGLVRPQSEEQIPLTPDDKNYADFSAGLIGYSENFFAGFAVHHLSQPEEEGFIGIAKLPMKFTVHAGATIDLKRKDHRFREPDAPTLSPNIIYQQQGTAQYLNYGVYLNVRPLVFGAWYRQTIGFNQPESLTFLVGIQRNTLHIGYSYDLSMSKLQRLSGGSHEISVGFGLPCPATSKQKYKMIKCPSY